MNFKEYLALEEDYDTFASLNEYDWLQTLASPYSFTAGLAGNLIGQGLRGAGNIVHGGAKVVDGLGSATTGSLQYLGGNKSAKKKAKERVKSGLAGIGGGLGKALRGATQIVATPITAPIRGVQAIDDKKIGGILSPNDPKRGYWQDLFGLDSGERDDNSQAEVPKSAKPIPPSPKTKPQTPDEWYQLTDRLRRATSKKEWIAIAAEMSRKYPRLYANAKKRAKMLSRRRPSTNPSGQLRSGPSRVSPKGFPGL